MSKAEKASHRAECIESLRLALRPGDRITCTVMRVSRSGMSRTIMLQIPQRYEDGRLYIRDISYMVAHAIGERFDGEGVVMTGCGMDMRFAAVYNLGRVLFRDGFGIEGTKATVGKRKPYIAHRRPKSRKAAAQMVRNGWVFRGRNGDASGWDTDGGYALDYRG